MKKQFLLFGLVIVLFSTCKKTSFNATSQAAIDDHKIQLYIAANHLTMTKDPSGIYYQIITPNPGPNPSSTDTVQVNFSGKLLNGNVFSPESIITTSLVSLTTGFQAGVRLIGANGIAPYGRILIIVPSALGYGSSSLSGIPSNSVLVFTIDLLGFY